MANVTKLDRFEERTSRGPSAAAARSRAASCSRTSSTRGAQAKCFGGVLAVTLPGRRARRRARSLLASSLALAAAAVSAAAWAATGASAADAQALLTHYKCYVCHADRESKAGPAYVDVATSLRSRKDAVSVLALTIRRGMRSGGPWHMPPHPEVSAEEARIMARYIMSLRD
jgi:cytochrome c